MNTVIRRYAIAASAAIVASLVLMFAAGPAAAKRPYPQGQSVFFSGVVSDVDGQRFAGVEVVLKGYRESFNLWEFRKTKKGASELTATTDENGEFTIEWRWDKFYNRFELTAGVGAGNGEWFALGEVDLSKLARQGSPVVSNVLVEDGDAARTLQYLAASLDSEEARRVYHEQGKPDKVQRVTEPSQVTVIWWYFTAGKSYRFRDGAIESIETFEPVESF